MFCCTTEVGDDRGWFYNLKELLNKDKYIENEAEENQWSWNFQSTINEVDIMLWKVYKLKQHRILKLQMCVGPGF